MRFWVSIGLILFTLCACSSAHKAPVVSNSPSKYLKIGTGSRIDILRDFDQFSAAGLPPGWVLDGTSMKEVFESSRRIPSIYMTHRDGIGGLHIMNGPHDFVLARYTAAYLLVTPYLSWHWYVSEHQRQHHPVRLLVGLYGGKTDSPPLTPDQLVWRGQGLPPFDRLLAIGFDDTALKRGNLYPLGQIGYYAQRGGIGQTNRWHEEATDLSLIYKTIWPQDDPKNVLITFVGFMSDATRLDGATTFRNIWLSK